MNQKMKSSCFNVKLNYATFLGLGIFFFLSLVFSTTVEAATWEGVAHNFFDDESSVTLDIPSGTQSDDLLVAVVYSARGDRTYTWPSGWNLIDESYTTFGALGMQVYWAWGDVADTTVTIGGGFQGFLSAVHRFSGVDQTSPIRDFSVTSDASGNDDQPTGSVDVEAGDAVLASWIAYQNDRAWGSPTSGYTSRIITNELIDSPDTRSSGSWRWAAATQEEMEAGPTGPISHSQDNRWEWRAESAIAIAAGNGTEEDPENGETEGQTALSGFLYSDESTLAGAGEEIGAAYVVDGGVVVATTSTDTEGEWGMNIELPQGAAADSTLTDLTLVDTVQPGNESYTVAWDEEGEYVAVGRVNELLLYALDNDELVLADNIPSGSFGFIQHLSWNGDFLAMSGADSNSLLLFKLDRGDDSISLVHTPTPPPDKSFAHSWNGNYLAVGTGDWSGSDGQNLTLYELDPVAEELNRLIDPTPATNRVFALDWNGDILALGIGQFVSVSDRIQLYELDGGSLVSLPDPTDNVDRGIFSLKWNGDFLAVKDEDSILYLFELVDGDLVEQQSISLPSNGATQRHMAWFNDYLAVPHGGGDNLYLYELVDGQLVAAGVSVPSLAHRGVSADWSPDGQYLVVGGSDPSGETTSDLYLLDVDLEGGEVLGDTLIDSVTTFMITGNLLVTDHSEGQVGNQFSFQNVDDAPLFAFNVDTEGEFVSVNQISFNLDGAVSLLDRVSNFRLYRDADSDRTVSGGDILLADTASVTTIGSTVRVTFIESFEVSSESDMLLVADILHPPSGSSMQVSLNLSNLLVLGQISGGGAFVFDDVTGIMHNRTGGGGGSIGVQALGTEVITGGGGGGGTSITPGDGDSLSPQPGYFAPQSTGAVDDEWDDAENAFISDDTYATADTEEQSQSFGTFGFNIPSSNTVTGVIVRLESSATTEAGSVAVALSWDGGTTFTEPLHTTTLTTLDAVYTLGGQSNTWGRSWSVSDFANENFKIRIIANPDSNLIRVDALQVRPVHQATGGSGSGGGAI